MELFVKGCCEHIYVSFVENGGDKRKFALGATNYRKIQQLMSLS